MGPWGHQYPEDGTPGPRIGFLPEAVRWWDHWLKQVDTGIMDEPLLRVWMQDSVEPRTSYDVRPGRWVAEPAWPSPKIAVKREALRLPEDTISNTSVVGLEAGCWCGFGVCGDFAPDQRREDGLSLCSTSDPLDRSIEVLGFPKVSFTVDSDRPQAQVAVRLCDVHPGGASLLVTRGVLNLTHRKSHEEPSPLTVGEPVRVTITLNSIAHVFPVGHRIRVGISPIYWPWAWPSPEIGTLTISDGELELPVRAGSDGDQPLRPFHVPELARPLAHEIEGTPSSRRRLEHDLATGRSVLTWDHDLSRGVRWKLPDGLEFSSHGGDVFSIVEGKPLSARVRSNWSLRLARDDWRVRIETTGSLSADATTFHAANSLKAYEDDREIFTRSWRFDIPRDQG
jgi:hypothetical protein